MQLKLANVRQSNSTDLKSIAYINTCAATEAVPLRSQPYSLSRGAIQLVLLQLFIGVRPWLLYVGSSDAQVVQTAGIQRSTWK